MIGMSRNTKWFAMELGILLIGLVAGLMIPYANLAVLGLCVWMVLFEQDYDGVLDLAFFLLPLSPVFKLGLHGFALYNLVWLLLLLRLLWENGFRFHFPNAAPALLIFYLLAGFQTANPADCIRLICQMLVCMEVLADAQIRLSLNTKRKNTMLALGIVSSSGIALCKDAFPRLAAWLGEGDSILLPGGMVSYRFMGLEQNPNMYTVLLSVSLAVYCVYMLQKNVNWFDLVLMGCICLLGTMTISLSFVVTLAVTLVLTGIFAWEQNRVALRVLLAMAVLLGVLVGIYAQKLRFLAAMVIRVQRAAASTGDLSNMTTGRWEIWMHYLAYFRDHPIASLLGHGLGAAGMPEPHAHSYYLEMVYYLGYLGTAVYLSALWSVFTPSQYAQKKTRWYRHLPLLVLLIRGSARNLICEEKLMPMYLLYTLTAIHDRGENENV